MATNLTTAEINIINQELWARAMENGVKGAAEFMEYDKTPCTIDDLRTPLNRWDKRFLALALVVSGWSKGPSTKCGAVITRGNHIISLGFNGFPMLVNDDESRYNDRDLKLQMILHAEVNAILFAKESLGRCTIYTQPFPPCCRCAAMIIQSGIKKVIAPRPDDKKLERWGKELEISRLMYSDAGVKLMEVF